MKRKITKQLEAIAYARFSPRPNAKDCESNDAQLENCRAMCARKGYRLIAEFQDAAASGDDMDRPGLWDAIKTLKRGAVLVIESPTRMARSIYLDELIRREVAAVGARLEFVEGGQDDSPEGALIRTVLAAFAEYRKRFDAVMTSKRMRRHQATGRRMGKVCPFGWRDDEAGPRNEKGQPARMVPDAAEQAIVARILSLHAQGYGSHKISTLLEAEGVLCRGKERWGRDLVEAIVRRGTEGGEAGQQGRQAS